MICTGLAQRLPRLWFRPRLAITLVPLLPLSWLFFSLVRLRQFFYRVGWLKSRSLPVPVVVVGNLTVGGSGKTPFVLWLAESLRELGWRPGIISRGYGGAGEAVRSVTSASDASLVGDEPLLLARRSCLPVFVGRDRMATAQALLQSHPECNVIISDDGLQHYRLRRDAEIVIFDGRGSGNSKLLPAGPLREPLSRLATVTAVVWNGGNGGSATAAAKFRIPEFSMRLLGCRFLSLHDASRFCTPENFHGKEVHAIAGIGDPSRFFAQLDALSIRFQPHPFPDHFSYEADDLAFARDGVILMTEKDAVKCRHLGLGEAWVLPVDAQIDAGADGKSLLEMILEKLNGCTLA